MLILLKTHDSIFISLRVIHVHPFGGPTQFLAVPGAGATWAAAKADGEKREKALRAAIIRES
jgi:hypothetical protein